jgi:hypothetical protein
MIASLEEGVQDDGGAGRDVGATSNVLEQFLERVR